MNELRYLQLKEVKVSFCFYWFVSCSFLFFNIQYGVELDLPAATILSMFGLRAQVISSPFIQMPRLIILFPCPSRSGGRTSPYWLFSSLFSLLEVISHCIIS